MKSLILVLISTFFVMACEEAELGKRDTTGDSIVDDFSNLKGKNFRAPEKEKDLFIKIIQTSIEKKYIVIESYYINNSENSERDPLQTKFNCNEEDCVSTRLEDKNIIEYLLINEERDVIKLSTKTVRGKLVLTTFYYLD